MADYIHALVTENDGARYLVFGPPDSIRTERLQDVDIPGSVAYLIPSNFTNIAAIRYHQNGDNLQVVPYDLSTAAITRLSTIAVEPKHCYSCELQNGSVVIVEKIPAMANCGYAYSTASPARSSGTKPIQSRRRQFVAATP